MPRKPPRPRAKTDPEQHKRFIDMAHEVEADESPDALDRAFTRVVRPKVDPRQPTPRASSRSGDRSN
jgi:hypothetical protein